MDVGVAFRVMGSLALKSCDAIVERARWLVMFPRTSAVGTPALQQRTGINILLLVVSVFYCFYADLCNIALGCTEFQIGNPGLEEGELMELMTADSEPSRLGRSVASSIRKMVLHLMAGHTKCDQVVQCIVAELATLRHMVHL